MARFRYDLKLLIVAMSNICVLAWATKSPDKGSALVAIVTGLSYVWYGSAKGKRSKPVLGALGGFTGMVMISICVVAKHFIDYNYHTGNVEYFEDGILYDLVYVPIVLIIVLGSYGAIVGMICGTVILGIQKLLTILKC